MSLSLLLVISEGPGGASLKTCFEGSECKGLSCCFIGSYNVLEALGKVPVLPPEFLVLR